MTQQAKNTGFWGILSLFALVLYYQSYVLDRSGQLPLFVSIALIALCYIGLLHQSKAMSEIQLYFAALVLHLIPIFCLPPLSNDFYRFLWDGEMFGNGINPYDFKPNELITQAGFAGNAYYWELYAGMGQLSQENYSCYPVFNQFYFLVSTFFTDNLYFNLILLRLLVVASVWAGFYYLNKLLLLADCTPAQKWMYIFNPLLIIEVSQNLHFEGVMLTFTLMGFYFLAKRNWFYGGMLLTFAIQIKLLPLMMLPFLLRWLGWKQSIFAWLTVGASTAVLSLLLIDSGNYLHFLQSLALYFRQFEFNSFFMHWYLEYGQWQYGYNRIQSYGPYFSRLAAKAILIAALLGDKFTLQQVFKRMLFALFIYYLLATTVHPWYILTPLLFSVFTQYRFIQVWSILVFLSYSWYSSISEETFRWINLAEYSIVLVVFGVEMFKKRAYFRLIFN